jgi:hypothetical protein
MASNKYNKLAQNRIQLYREVNERDREMGAEIQFEGERVEKGQQI